MGAALLRTSGTPAAVVRSARAAEDVAAALVAAESTSFAAPSRAAPALAAGAGDDFSRACTLMSTHG